MCNSLPFISQLQPTVQNLIKDVLSINIFIAFPVCVFALNDPLYMVRCLFIWQTVAAIFLFSVDWLTIVAFFQNATKEYSSESLCVCPYVCVCVCVCVCFCTRTRKEIDLGT